MPGLSVISVVPSLLTSGEQPPLGGGIEGPGSHVNVLIVVSVGEVMELCSTFRPPFVFHASEGALDLGPDFVILRGFGACATFTQCCVL